MNHHPANMLLDAALDEIVHPATQFSHDWMHALLVSGVFQHVLYLVLKAIKNHGIADIYQMLEQYVAMWTLEKRFGTSTALANMFAKKRETADEKAKMFKCQASDALSVYSIIAFYLVNVIMPAGIAIAECSTFLALANLLDLFTSSHTGAVTPTQLAEAAEAFLDMCVVAGWKQHMVPKFHWLVHFKSNLRKWGMLLSCFVHERKHRMVKRYSTDIQNTRRCEWSTLSEVTCHHIADLADERKFDFTPHLLQPVRKAPAKMKAFLDANVGSPYGSEWFTSNAARLSQNECCQRLDVVLVKSMNAAAVYAGQIWFIAEVDDVRMALVSLWEPIAAGSHTSCRRWRFSEANASIVDLADVVCACAWKRDGDFVQTLVPYLYRGFA